MVKIKAPSAPIRRLFSSPSRERNDKEPVSAQSASDKLQQLLTQQQALFRDKYAFDLAEFRPTNQSKRDRLQRSRSFQWHPIYTEQVYVPAFYHSCSALDRCVDALDRTLTDENALVSPKPPPLPLLPSVNEKDVNERRLLPRALAERNVKSSVQLKLTDLPNVKTFKRERNVPAFSAASVPAKL